MELREKLTPRVSLREPIGWPTDDDFADIFGDLVEEDDHDEESEDERITDLAEWKIVLSTDHVHSSLQDLSRDAQWTSALPDLLSDFTSLLRDALDLMRELDGADSRTDHSYIHQPSISKHPQNQGFQPWTALIDLTRDAWLATGGPVARAGSARSGGLEGDPISRLSSLGVLRRHPKPDNSEPTRTRLAP